ncbi:hypothetical protein AB5I41_02275 [Sphingomonas sp. MMS24-JH45]
MRVIASEIDHEDRPRRARLPAPRPRGHDLQGQSARRLHAQFRVSGPSRRAGPEARGVAALDPAERARRHSTDGELVAVGDCLPPAALRILGRNVPMSSLTWILNVLGPEPRTDDGWWLLRSDADYARAGSSSQVMGVWNAAGEKVAEQMQSVTIFG